MKEVVPDIIYIRKKGFHILPFWLEIKIKLLPQNFKRWLRSKNIVKLLDSKYNWWRKDKMLWEEKVVVLGILPIYKYSIWSNGKTRTSFRLFRYSGGDYMKKAVSSVVYVGKKEFEQKYGGNKYGVPVNKVLDLDIP
jgi:hypothetical protein